MIIEETTDAGVYRSEVTTIPHLLPICEMMARLPDGSHQPTDYWLMLDPYDCEYHCSCGSLAIKVAGPNLWGCRRTVGHGCRNLTEVNSYLLGLIAAMNKRRDDNGIWGRL